MSKKKSQIITIISLIIVLIAAGIGYFAAVKYQNKKASDDKEDKSVALNSIDESSVSKISFSYDGTDMTFEKKNDEWVYTDDKDFPVNQSYVSTMVSDMAGMTATKLVTGSCKDLSQYKLDDPSIKVEITDKNGKIYNLSVGMDAVAADGCYVYTDNDTSKVYLAASDFTSDFKKSKNNMMALPDAPDIQSANVTSYKVDAGGTTSFSAVYDKKNSKYKDIYSWDITEPFTQPVAGDQDGLTSLFDKLSSVTFTEGAEYKSSDKVLKKYGLDSPEYSISVKYFTKNKKKKKYHTYTINVGKKDSAGENYYVKTSTDKGIYLMPSDIVSALARPDAFSCAYSNPYLANSETLNSITMNYKGKKYEMTLTKKKKKKKSSDLESSYDYTAYVDGRKVDSDSFIKAYKAFASLSYSAAIDKNVKVSDDKEIASIEFKQDKKNVKLRFLSYNDSFYRIDVDGTMQFVVDKAVVDKDLGAFVKLK